MWRVLVLACGLCVLTACAGNQGEQVTTEQQTTTPIGLLGDTARMLGVGSDPELGARLQRAGTALEQVGTPQWNAPPPRPTTCNFIGNMMTCE
jgi:hypothetical protein